MRSRAVIGLAVVCLTAAVQFAMPAGAQTPPGPSPFTVPPDAAAPLPRADTDRLEPSRKAPGPLYIREQSGNALLVTEYLGRPVHGPDQQKIGTISNILTDISGRVTGFVIEVGGFLGIGTKEVAISFEAVIPVREDNRDVFLIEMTKAQLAAAPTFKRAK